MELHKAMLDNNVVSVIQYHGIEYRCERKEYCFMPLQRVRVMGCKPGYVRGTGKCVRERKHNK